MICFRQRICQSSPELRALAAKLEQVRFYRRVPDPRSKILDPDSNKIIALVNLDPFLIFKIKKEKNVEIINDMVFIKNIGIGNVPIFNKGSVYQNSKGKAGSGVV